jgi:hypothetical protein
LGPFHDQCEGSKIEDRQAGHDDTNDRNDTPTAGMKAATGSDGGDGNNSNDSNDSNDSNERCFFQPARARLPRQYLSVSVGKACPA